MERILTILRVLDHSKNGIFLIHTEAGTVSGGNATAKKLFPASKGKSSLSEILGGAFTDEFLMERVVPDLMETGKCFVDNTQVTTTTGETLQTELDFVLATDDMEYIFMIIRLKEDRRPFYLQTLLRKSKHPAFLLDYGERFTVREGNTEFYNAFACTKDNIEEKYQSLFDNFLPEETREEDVLRIFSALAEKESDILDIHVQTSHGETLFFYYNVKKLRPLIDSDERCMFCLLVGKEETLENVEYPYDKLN